MKRLLFGLFTLLNLGVLAQDDVTASFKGAYNVYPVDTLGVVLLNRNMVQLSTGDLALEYSGLNHELEQTWKNMYPFSKGMSPVFQQVSPKGIILLFADKSGKRYELIKANTEYGDYERSRYEFSGAVQVSQVETYYDHVWMTGLIGPNPVIFKLKSDNSFETIPVGVPGRVKYIGETKFDPETKGLNFLILADIQKKDALIWRSLNLQGNVLRNEMLASFEKKKVRAVKAIYTANNALIAGTYSVGTKDKVEGLFWGKIDGREGALSHEAFKSLKGISTYQTFEDLSSEGFEKAKEKKFRGANASVFMDGLRLNENGQLMVALEVFKPEYRSRGALEREFIARDRTAQIDQNVYGRRNVFEANGGRDLEGRIDRASATDQIQMRFMNQSLSKAVNQGISYNHTAYLKIASDLKIVESQGLAFDLIDFGRLARVNHFIGSHFQYPQAHTYQSFDVSSKALNSLKVDEDISLMNWSQDRLLKVQFDEDNKRLNLSVLRLN
ncbi:hypothetical protein BFP97_04215 [Roseivirga sp. 4D4]|uniref:hypothetical protein n=1 Tax=Roseivirga sp. 4D4 TaxID=1889784 RepID=UPI0008538D58|nr:hypothetical protein [Roseivirga sp. 4D4]OEK00758.1 hypothetical protein BFP97_04215 [Roseivirga sp. 4D4]